MLRFKKILVHIDSRQAERPALAIATEIAKANQAELMLADIIPDVAAQARLFPGETKHIADQISEAKSHKLKSICEAAEASGISASYTLLPAPTSLSLIREAVRGDYDLLVKDSKGDASSMWGLFGTTATRLLRHSPCPTLLVKPELGDQGSRGRFARVVAAVDADSHDELYMDLNERIIAHAEAVCRPEGCAFEIVSAWSVQSENLLKSHMKEEEFELLCEKTKAMAKTRFDELVDKSEAGAKAEHCRLLHGEAGEQIPVFANENRIDLLVLGTIGRSGIAGLLMGNTAERILNKVECSVLAVKPEGFVSSIRP